MECLHVFSADTAAFNTLTNDPTPAQCQAASRLIIDRLHEMLDDQNGLVDPDKWPLSPEFLAGQIKIRLCSPDWYAGLMPGDAEIWNTLLEEILTANDPEIGLGLIRESTNSIDAGLIGLVVKKGSRLQRLRKFGRCGFRHHSRLHYDPQLIYSIHLPGESGEMLHQMEQALTDIATQSAEQAGDREMVESRLLEPLRNIVKSGRSTWLQWQH